MDESSSARAADWLGHESSPQSHLAVVGLPVNWSRPSEQCQLAPGAIRRALAKLSVFDCDNQVDLRLINGVDLGDITDFGKSPEDEIETVTDFFRRQQTATGVRVLLGGDNDVTRLGVHSFALPLNRVGLINLDAHYDGHGDVATGRNVTRTLISDGLRGTNIVQIGIQPFANSPENALFARDAGISVETVDEIYDRGIETVVARALARLASADAIYINFDLDVLDQAFAPACSGAQPGGLPPWMLRKVARMCGAAPKVRALDLIGIDPGKDRDEMTALAAASFFLAFASGVASRLKSF